MDNKQFFIYLLIMALSTYLIRAVPFAAFTKKIQNRFIRSFLYYIPYTVLSVMTVPAVFFATGSVICAAIGVVIAVVVAILSKNLLLTAGAASLSVFIAQAVITL